MFFLIYILAIFTRKDNLYIEISKNGNYLIPQLVGNEFMINNQIKSVKLVGLTRNATVYDRTTENISYNRKTGVLSVVFDDIKTCEPEVYSITYHLRNGKKFHCIYEVKTCYKNKICLEKNTDRAILVYFINRFYKYFFEMYLKDKNFSRVPTSTFLLTKRFIKEKTSKNLHCFYKHKGLKACLDLLKSCLGQVSNYLDIHHQVVNFIEEIKVYMTNLDIGLSNLKETESTGISFIELAKLFTDLINIIEFYSNGNFDKENLIDVDIFPGKIEITQVLVIKVNGPGYNPNIHDITIKVSDKMLQTHIPTDYLWICNYLIYLSYDLIELHNGEECVIEVTDKLFNSRSNEFIISRNPEITINKIFN